MHMLHMAVADGVIELPDRKKGLPFNKLRA